MTPACSGATASTPSRSATTASRWPPGTRSSCSTRTRPPGTPWNAYGQELARETGARAVRISDGGITGPAFFDHVRRGKRPLVNSPKGQTAPLPPDLVQRPVIAPEIYWTWSLAWRRGEARASVLSVVEALRDDGRDHGIHGPDAWLPKGDPYRR